MNHERNYERKYVYLPTLFETMSQQYVYNAHKDKLKTTNKN